MLKPLERSANPTFSLKGIPSFALPLRLGQAEPPVRLEPNIGRRRRSKAITLSNQPKELYVCRQRSRSLESSNNLQPCCKLQTERDRPIQVFQRCPCQSKYASCRQNRQASARRVEESECRNRCRSWRRHRQDCKSCLIALLKAKAIFLGGCTWPETYPKRGPGDAHLRSVKSAYKGGHRIWPMFCLWR